VAKKTPENKEESKEEKKAEKPAKKAEKTVAAKTEEKPAKKEEKPAKKEEHEEKPETAAPTEEDFQKVDIRVGRIVECWKHPESENLYCEKIDIGTEVRQIASGL
jgi:tRNA-binding EMAP/Myf-like protein